jgi:hypothetical protein
METETYPVSSSPFCRCGETPIHQLFQRPQGIFSGTGSVPVVGNLRVGGECASFSTAMDSSLSCHLPPRLGGPSSCLPNYSGKP